ncbi:SDR family NAD(P)-dependent oxidoreductase [Scopulibacillus cellulosilyticus]|uniref:SDR family NAD(P)-dependent oxidoreductase n=1 Tax=Scopulibacillus cellulosilyticus TaxID=2665665 RepID=A0ABW2PTT4_9BACL
MKTAIITGAARGIGQSIAKRLYDAGYQLVLADVLEEDLHNTARELTGQTMAVPKVVDVREPSLVKELMAETFQQFGEINAVVNVAGTCHRESFEDTTIEAWRMDVDTNMTGTFLMCQAAIFPYMKQQGHGRIVNIASVSGKLGGIGPVNQDGSGGRSGIAYAASKAGVINLTRWIAREVGKWGITCNSIAPGPIATEMTQGHKYQMEDVPVQRWGTPEDVAGAAEFLLREENSFITGTCLNVDGGLVLA